MEKAIQRTSSDFVDDGADEQWPTKFVDPAAAIGFADAFLLTPNYGSGLDVTPGRKAVSNEMGVRFTKERLYNEAATISCCLAMCGAPEQYVYRFVWGRYKAIGEVADILAKLVHKPGDVTLSGMKLLARAALYDFRKRSKGQGKVHASSISKMLGISRSTYYEHWHPYRKDMQPHIRQWVVRAEHQFREKLEERGIM